MNNFKVKQFIQFQYRKGIWQTACISDISDDLARVFWFSKGSMRGKKS